MEIINKMILSSVLELLLWSTGKVCICFCNIKMFKKLLILCKVTSETSTTSVFGVFCEFFGQKVSFSQAQFMEHS